MLQICISFNSYDKNLPFVCAMDHNKGGFYYMQRTTIMSHFLRTNMSAVRNLSKECTILSLASSHFSFTLHYHSTATVKLNVQCIF